MARCVDSGSGCGASAAVIRGVAAVTTQFPTQHPTAGTVTTEMGKRYDALDARLIDFIRAQPVFFVGTAAAEGRVNVSPKGMDTLRVLDERRIVWLNLTGSGNETAAHLRESSRMTLMFCAFSGDPKILRVYGSARAIHPRDAEWHELLGLFPSLPGARQIVDMRVELAMTSCGFGVPLLEYRGEREILREWSEKKARDGIEDYWARKNATSVDGKSTGITEG